MPIDVKRTMFVRGNLSDALRDEFRVATRNGAQFVADQAELIAYQRLTRRNRANIGNSYELGEQEDTPRGVTQHVKSDNPVALFHEFGTGIYNEDDPHVIFPQEASAFMVPVSRFYNPRASWIIQRIKNGAKFIRLESNKGFPAQHILRDAMQSDASKENFRRERAAAVERAFRRTKG